MTVLSAVLFARDASQLQRKLIAAVGGGLFLGLVGDEFYAGYRNPDTAVPRDESGR